MQPVPILFLSDSPDLPTGLARITRDLATLTATLPHFRVGTLGRGGHGSSKLPFAQYNFNEIDQWGEGHIEPVWHDFAGQSRGIIMTVWDPSRLGWFAQPRMTGPLQAFLTSGRFERWGYIPVDSYGVGGKLTGMVTDTLRSYDRILAYTLFGKSTIEASMGTEVDWIPHGFDADVFQPRLRAAGRSMLRVDPDVPLVGCVMTNQSRKDWATAFGAIAHLKNRIHNVKFWAHVDTLERYWNLLALAHDFGLTGTVIFTLTGNYTSEALSCLYSCCDVTMLPSLGEGFGYPIVESLACGVPVIHGNYGGGAEFVPDSSWLVQPVTERLDGMWNNVRPVWNPLDWSNTLHDVIQNSGSGILQEVCTAAVDHLNWKNLWPGAWSKWMLSGIDA